MDRWNWAIWNDEILSINILNMIIKWFNQQFEQPPVEKNVNAMVQMLTLTYLYEETKNPTYLPYLETWRDWLYHDMPRTKSNGHSLFSRILIL
ncbi:glycoside hydrolase family 88 protein [Priestia filamentosa]|uniref:glycoside hydrolase family 88 protein n=1 Tax=Priestia filamentosa TaxID=1402861 RepID=UPI002E212D22|nr:glycoside hydrolase family 88 protein [Priestia filamentosa]